MNKDIASVLRKRAIEIPKGILSAEKPEIIGKLDDIPTNHIGNGVSVMPKVSTSLELLFVYLKVKNADESFYATEHRQITYKKIYLKMLADMILKCLLT